MRENEVSDPPAIGHAKKRNRRHFPSGSRAAAAPLTNVKLSKSVNPRVAVKTACEPSAAAAGSRYFR